MSKVNQNVHVYSDQNYAVWVGNSASTLPTTTLPPTAPTGYYELGLLSDAGVTEGHNLNETKIYDMSGALVRIARNQEERPFTFEALEANAIVAGLLYPGSTVSATGATAEIQTLTITGAPTGGTFPVTLPGYGTATLLYNETTSSAATKLSAAFGIPVTVTGTPTSSYVITYPTLFGNAPQATTSAASLTGGTTPTASVATSTPGVQGTNSRVVGAGTGRNLRPFCIDLVDGTVHKRIVIGSGEAVQTGTITYSGSGAAIYQFTLQPYTYAFPGGNGFYNILDDDPASGEAFV